MSYLLKLFNAFIMLVIWVVLSVLFGWVGFLIGLLLTVVVSMTLSRAERDIVEKKRHKEIIQAIAQRGDNN